MLHFVKVGTQVHVNDTSLLLDNRLCHSVHRLMSCSFRSVSVRSRLEVRFEDRLQDELERPLDHAVTNRRNRKNSNLVTSVLPDFFLPCPHGPIRVCDQFTLYLFQITLYSAFFNSLKRDPIDSREPRRFSWPFGRLRTAFLFYRREHIVPKSASLVQPSP